MKKIYLTFYLLIIIVSSFCQTIKCIYIPKISNVYFKNGRLYPADSDKEFDSGSKITIPKLNIRQIDNLKALGLVWGFLKYYHPNIAGGVYNWDYELFRILPKILNSENDNKRDSILCKWIDGIGHISLEKTSKTDSFEIKFEPDLDWIQELNFSDTLLKILNKIKNAERQKVHYYIELSINGTPNFKNENAYATMKYPDTGFRLLSLFRYWNIIQYYFPYKNLINEDWKNVLEEFIPKFIDAKNETEYTLFVLELIARIHDAHATILEDNQILKEYFGVNYAAAEISFVENKAVVTGYYILKSENEIGLKIGDIITKVNDKPVNEIINERLKYICASNYQTQSRNIAIHLLRTNDTIINIEFIRDDKKSTKIVKTYTSKEINVLHRFMITDTCYKLIKNDIAYINNSSLKKTYLSKIWEEVKNKRGLIIDVRNYPSDFPLYDLCNYLLPHRTPFYKKTMGSIENPGQFHFAENYGDQFGQIGQENKDFYKGKVIIIINELTQSSAEFHTMAYRVHPNAKLIGSPTAGTDGNISKFYLPGGICTQISGIGIYYPDGKETQRIGIIPDIVCKPTIKGIKNKRDELIEKAIEIINGQ